MNDTDLANNDCNYRFKGNSCDECPLNCIYKNRNDMYRAFKLMNEIHASLILTLRKIRDICHEAPAIDSELSLRILEVIKGAKDE